MTREDWRALVRCIPAEDAVTYLIDVIVGLTDAARADAVTVADEAAAHGVQISHTRALVLALLLRYFGQTVPTERIEVHLDAHAMRESELWDVRSLIKHLRNDLRALPWNVEIGNNWGVGWYAQTIQGQTRSDPLA